MATQVDEWTPLVLTKLEVLLGTKTGPFIALLKETGAVIAGGFVLQAIVKYIATSDMDIYVPTANMPTFLNGFINGEQMMIPDITSSVHFDATVYCRSFLRKNSIRRVHTFKGRPYEQNSVDVMSVRTRKTPVEVCSNFDLTMCQVWFDGTHVFATHPDHIREKKGFLQGDYIQTFINGNKFLKSRLLKYKNRGFTITYDPSALASVPTAIPSIDAILSKDIACSKDSGEDVLRPWLQRALMQYLLMPMYPDEPGMTSDTRLRALPMNSNDFHHNYQIHRNQTFRTNTPQSEFRRLATSVPRIELEHDEGYDSEDMDMPKLAELAVSTYTAPTPEEEKDLATRPLDPALVYGRQIFRLLYNTFTETSNLHNFYYIFHELNDTLKMYRDYIDEQADPIRKRYLESQLKDTISILERVTRYSDYLIQHAPRTGMDFAGDEGPLYDIHNHPMDSATTRDSLEGYLEQFIRVQDKSAGVPCYHKPEVHAAHEANCQRPITLKEIQTIVSPEFFVKFAAPQPIKTGLNIVMPVYNAVLPNTKSLEEGYGEEYHETMCPFCLQPMTRGSGCSYMTHENPKRLDASHTPFCQPEFVVRELLDKYKQAAARIQPDLPAEARHIEVCVECGRPCLGHQHFAIDAAGTITGLVPARLIPDPANPSRMIYDYATCAGGGRPELFARMLAVRDIYTNMGLKNPKEERAVAALHADTAAFDPAYVARGKAIADMPPAERAFNTKVPRIKKYNDPAYEDVSEEEAPAVTNEAMHGGRRNTTYKRRTGSRTHRRKTYKRRK